MLLVCRSLKWYIKESLSELNLENYIQQAFQRSAVEILYNPYQGLKQVNHHIDRWFAIVEILYNPYQGLKRYNDDGIVVDSCRNPL
ncbi:MAG: hypothetical protein ACLFWI_20710 [Coleofasciculus sp.]